MRKVIIVFCIFIILLFAVFIGYRIVDADFEVYGDISFLSYQNDISKKINSYGYTFDNPNIILNPYEISPLTALIVFETDEVVSISVTVVGKSDDSTFSYTDNASNVHYLYVYGLYPDYNNHIKISYENNVKDIYIKTDKLPDDLEDVNVSLDGFSSYLKFVTVGVVYPYAYDVNGDIRWYFNKNFNGNISYLANNHIMLSNDMLSTKGVVEVDLLGKVYKEYINDYSYYMSYYELSNGNFVCLALKNVDGILRKYLVLLNHQDGNVISDVDLTDLFTSDNNFSIGYDDVLDEIVIINDVYDVVYISKDGFEVMYATNIVSELGINVYDVVYYNNRIIFVSSFDSSFYYSLSDNTFNDVDGNFKLVDFGEVVDEFRYSDFVPIKEGILLKDLSVSEVSSSNLFIFKYYDFSKLADNNIIFMMEEGRLVMQGDFSSNSSVKIILDKFMKKRIYDVNIMDGDVVFYINDTLLNGKYFIYMYVDDKIYKTNYYVAF